MLSHFEMLYPKAPLTGGWGEGLKMYTFLGNFDDILTPKTPNPKVGWVSIFFSGQFMTFPGVMNC